MWLVAVPNPSRGSAGSVTLPFVLPETASVRLSVYDALGREVAVLVDGTRSAGEHAAVWDGSALPSGAYVVRLEAGDGHVARPVLLVR